MSDLEPLEPQTVRHVLDTGLSKTGDVEFAYNHFDYRWGEEPEAIWARAHLDTASKVTVHNLEHHDIQSDHITRMLMYLAARFRTIEVFDPNSETGYHPLPDDIDKRVRDLVAEHLSARQLKVAGWEESAQRYKA